MAKQQDNDEWEGGKEAAPTMVSFDEIGDRFLGIKKGMEVITNPNPEPDGSHKEWNQWLFTGIFPDELAGEHCGINGTADLDKVLATVPDGYETQLTYVKDVPTRKGNPLKSFDVRWRKPQHSRVSAT